MFCGKCGTKVNDSASYCPKCGEKLKRASAPAQSQVTSPPSRGIKTEHRYRGIITIVVVCLVLLALIAVISSASNGYYRQVLGEWYLQGESDPVFTLYKDKSCLIANSDVDGDGQKFFREHGLFLQRGKDLKSQEVNYPFQHRAWNHGLHVFLRLTMKR